VVDGIVTIAVLAACVGAYAGGLAVGHALFGRWLDGGDE